MQKQNYKKKTEKDKISVRNALFVELSLRSFSGCVDRKEKEIYHPV